MNGFGSAKAGRQLPPGFLVLFALGTSGAEPGLWSACSTSFRNAAYRADKKDGKTVAL